MSKIIIESSNKQDTPADIEDKLEKAAESIRLQRETKQFSDLFLKSQKDKADKVVAKVLDNMCKEIENVLKP